MDPWLLGGWKWDLWVIKLFCLVLFGAADSGFISGVSFAQLNTRGGDSSSWGSTILGSLAGWLMDGSLACTRTSKPPHRPHSQQPTFSMGKGCAGPSIMGCVHQVLNKIQPPASRSNPQPRVGNLGIPHGWGNKGPLQVHISGWTANFGYSVCTALFSPAGIC